MKTTALPSTSVISIAQRKPPPRGDAITEGPRPVPKRSGYAPQSPLIGSVFAGHMIESMLHDGGTGRVFLAEKDGGKRALKIAGGKRLSAGQVRQSFIREADALSSLRHERIARLAEHGIENRKRFISLGYLEGMDLGDMLCWEGYLEHRTALPLFLDVLDALEFAHSRGIIHSDIKPDNIRVVEGSRAVLFDFGSARFLDRMGDLQKDIVKGHILTTVQYLAPEFDSESFSVRSDIYAMGITMYQTLSGALPFNSADISDTIAMHKNAVPEPLFSASPFVPSLLSEIVMRCIEKDPKARFRNAGELRDSLKQV